MIVNNNYLTVKHIYFGNIPPVCFNISREIIWLLQNKLRDNINDQIFNGNYLIQGDWGYVLKNHEKYTCFHMWHVENYSTDKIFTKFPCDYISCVRIES